MEEKTNKNEFPKTKEVSLETLKEKTNDYLQVKLADLPINQHITATFLQEPEVKTNSTEEYGDITTYTFLVKYTEYNLETPLYIRVGENAYKRFVNKYTDPEDYIGKKGKFVKTAYKGTNPQFVYVFNSDRKFPTKEEAFTPKLKPAKEMPIIKTEKPQTKLKTETKQGVKVETIQ